MACLVKREASHFCLVVTRLVFFLYESATNSSQPNKLKGVDPTIVIIFAGLWISYIVSLDSFHLVYPTSVSFPSPHVYDTGNTELLASHCLVSPP